MFGRSASRFSRYPGGRNSDAAYPTWGGTRQAGASLRVHEPHREPYSIPTTGASGGGTSKAWSVGAGHGASPVSFSGFEPAPVAGRQRHAFGRGWAAGLMQARAPEIPVSTAPSQPNAASSSVSRQVGGGGKSATTRLLGAMALLRSPIELDSEGLGKAATAAAREGIDDDAWWGQMSARARTLAPTLALHDVVLILNGMARARRVDHDFVEAVMPRICTHLVYLTSAHLAMISSAIAKAGIHNPRFAGLLARELKARLVEFHSPMEITMIVNAVSKLRVADEDLYRRLATHILNRMGHEIFHVQELSVIVGALARVQCVDAATMNRFADCAVDTLPQATPLELANLMHACMSVSCSADDFFEACVYHCRSQVRKMDPGGLTNAAFAFGKCFEVAQVSHLPHLRQMFKNIRLASIASLPLFLPREIVSLLHTCARWQVPLEYDNLRRVADRMVAIRTQFDVENSVAALYSLSVLLQRNAARSAADSSALVAAWVAVSSAASCLLEPAWKAVTASELDAVTIVRAVEASAVLLRPPCVSNDTQNVALESFGASAKQVSDLRTSAVSAVSACVAQRRVTLDGSSRSALYESLADLGCSPEDDVMLVLAESAPAAPP